MAHRALPYRDMGLDYRSNVQSTVDRLGDVHTGLLCHLAPVPTDLDRDGQASTELQRY